MYIDHNSLMTEPLLDTPKFIFRDNRLIERGRILRVRSDHFAPFWCCAEKWQIYVDVATTPSGYSGDGGSTNPITTYTFSYDNESDFNEDKRTFYEISNKNMKLYK